MRSAFGLILAEAGERDAATAIYRDELARYADALPHFWLTNVAMLGELCAGLRDDTGARALYAALSPYAHRNVVIGYGSCWGPWSAISPCSARPSATRRLAPGTRRLPWGVCARVGPKG